MTTQVYLALERFVAESAREGFVPGVLAHVCDEVRALAERLRAHHAFVRLLTCNNKYILYHCVLALHSLITSICEIVAKRASKYKK